MAKNTEAAASTSAPAGGDNRSIVLKNGEKRADYIRRRWTEGASRSDITKELNSAELNPTPDKKIPYQIVFQATKGREGGPPKNTETSSTSSAQPAAESEAVEG